MVFTQTPADSSITKYAYSTNGSSYTDITNTSGSGYQLSSPLTLSVSGLTNGTNYSFTLKAYNGVYSDASASVSSTVYIPTTAPVITDVTSSSNTATINFTQTQSYSIITKYGYSINGSTPIYINQTTSPLTITGLTNGTSYTFTIVANNGTDSPASNSVGPILIRPTLHELLNSVATKTIITNFGYSLQDLINSNLFTLSKLQVAGYTLDELKPFFGNEALIISWKYSGQELHDNGIIPHGISFIYLVIGFNNEFKAYKIYSEKDTNEEERQYNVYFEGQYLQHILSSIPF